MAHRHERIEELIRESLADIIMREIKDPRMPPIITVTKVEVSKDLHYANVSFTQMPEDDEEIDETLEVLEHASGFLRHALAEDISLRHTPQLRFFYDEQDRSTRRIEELLEQAKRKKTPEN